MQRLILVSLTIVLTSFYLFPIAFSFFPALNTKNIMAGLGLVVGALVLVKNRASIVNRDFFILSLYALMVSIAGVLSVLYNNTIDYSYATYIISMWIWVSAAFVLVRWIRLVHGYVSVVLLANYMIVVCICQCVSALLIDAYPAFKNWVDSFIINFGFVTQEVIAEKNRLYGIGAVLDVGGTRFAAVLVILAYVLTIIERTKFKSFLLLYVVAFFIVGIVGNFIARTTTLGIVLAVVFLVWVNRNRLIGINRDNKLWRFILLVLVISAVISTYLYHHSPSVKENFRFAFEGFFSWVEKGSWESHSTNMLKRMVILPDELKTWIIGDGYFNAPSMMDPNYIGPIYTGFYKYTDIGYLRFIYYFGIIGTFLFMLFFCKVANVCMRRFRNQRSVFFFILLLNFIIWCKVSTDIFIIFAPFLCISQDENEDFDLRVSVTNKNT